MLKAIEMEEMFNRLKSAKQAEGYIDIMLSVDIVVLLNEVKRLQEENERLNQRLEDTVAFYNAQIK